MKGIVFTEFLEMVENGMSSELADRIIEDSDLPSEGAYTSLGTYDHTELIQLVTQLSERTGIPKPELTRTFGKYLFGRFFALYPVFFEGVESSFEFVERVQEYVHLEVKKLYSDAELPTFVCENRLPGRLVMIYRSSRPFGDLAEGLLLGCFDHFGEEINIQREILSGGQGTGFRFILSVKDSDAKRTTAEETL